MRRLGIAVVVLLVVLGGLYTGAWFFIASRVAAEAAKWADDQRAYGLDVTWQTIDVAGYPLAFRVELGEARLRETTPGRAVELRSTRLSASANPWNFRVWQLDAPEGLTAAVGPTGAPAATLAAAQADGEVAIDGEGEVSVSLALEEPVIVAGVRLAARDAALALAVPKEPARTHSDPAFSLTLELRGLALPEIPKPLPNAIDEASLDLTLFGPVPAGAPRQAAEAWRDGGGTIEIDKLAVRWGALGISGSGTLALDAELQPEAAFSGAVEGYDELLAALVAGGKLKAADARLARLALALLAKPGADGKPQLATSFTMQNGKMFLGPVKLGDAPRLSWP